MPAKHARNKSSSVSSTSLEKLLWKATGGAVLISAGVLGMQYYRSYSKNNITTEITLSVGEERQRILNHVVRGLSLPYVSGVFYDPDERLSEEYFLKLAREAYLGKAVTVSFTRSPKGYAMKVPTIETIIASGGKSPIFIGDIAFSEQIGGQYSKADWQNILEKGARYAQLSAEGYPNIESQWLSQQVNAGNISRELLSLVKEIDSSHYALSRASTKDVISKIRRQHAQNELRDALLQLTALSPKLSDSSKEFIEKTLSYQDLQIKINVAPSKPKAKFRPFTI